MEEMYVHYTIATVHAVASSRTIRLFVDIPLKAADRYFELYQARSLSFLQRYINTFVLIDEVFTYLAVAESRQFCAQLSPEIVAKCTRGLYSLLSDLLVKTVKEPNCLVALFRIDKCSVLQVQTARVE